MCVPISEVYSLSLFLSFSLSLSLSYFLSLFSLSFLCFSLFCLFLTSLSLCLYLCLSVCLSVCVSLCLSLSVCLAGWLAGWLSLCVSIYLLLSSPCLLSFSSISLLSFIHTRFQSHVCLFFCVFSSSFPTEFSSCKPAVYQNVALRASLPARISALSMSLFFPGSFTFIPPPPPAHVIM